MAIDTFLYYTHSGLRWLVVLLTVFAFGYLLLRAFQQKAFDKPTHLVVVIWSSVFGLQWLFGLALFIALGAFDVAHQWEHLVTMTIALAVAHAYVPLKKRPDSTRYYGVLASIIGVLILVYVGVARLPQGWSFEVNAPGTEQTENDADETEIGGHGGDSVRFVLRDDSSGGYSF